MDLIITEGDDDDAISFRSALSDSFAMENSEEEDDLSSANHDHHTTRTESKTAYPTRSTIRTYSNITAQHFTFNQDRSCIVMALSEEGFRIHTLPSAQDWYHKRPEQSPEELWNKTHVHQLTHVHNMGSISLCAMLHETSLLALVTYDTPRTLWLVHAKLGTTLDQLSFRTAILRVDMNRSTLVCLTSEGRLHCFSFLVQDTSSSSTSSTSSSMEANHRFDDIPLIHQYSIHILAPNENARLLLYSPHATHQGAFYDLSSHCLQGHSWLVTRSDTSIGHVSLYDTRIPIREDGHDSSVTPSGYILTRKAHDHSIARIAVGPTIFATASQKGTMIRIFRIPDGEFIHQLCRGTTPCPILSLVLNPNATIVAVCSAHNTIHIFRLYQEDRNRSMLPVMHRFMSWTSKTVHSSPQQVIHRPVSRIHLNRVIGTTQHILTLLDVDAASNDSYPTYLMLCTEKGDMLQYEISLDGQHRLIHTHNVLLS